MVTLNPRQAYLQRQEEKKPAPMFEYEVIDPHHKPDLNGELAGGKVYRRKGKEYVMLTAAQAQFYLDSGGIQAVAEPKP
jgi:hypothetical protein